MLQWKLWTYQVSFSSLEKHKQELSCKWWLFVILYSRKIGEPRRIIHKARAGSKSCCSTLERIQILQAWSESLGLTANVGIESLFGILCNISASEKKIREKERSIYILLKGNEAEQVQHGKASSFVSSHPRCFIHFLFGWTEIIIRIVDIVRFHYCPA